MTLIKKREKMTFITVLERFYFDFKEKIRLKAQENISFLALKREQFCQF